LRSAKIGKFFFAENEIWESGSEAVEEEQMAA
jgi:hypothetical protein